MKTLSNEEMKEFKGGASAAVVECIESFLDNSDWSVEKCMKYCGEIIPK
jgi:hypothetical protein